MKIRLITPAPRCRTGNRVTAERWARMLRKLGHRVSIQQEFHGERCDLLVALHARKSFASIERYHREWPGRPLVVALTGTDLYGDIRHDEDSRRALELADRLILLQPLGKYELRPDLRDKCRVIRQSYPPVRLQEEKSTTSFEVCVVGHLRPVKDPFRTAEAARHLPATSRIRVLHAGAALTRDMEERALQEAAENARYSWLGDLTRLQVRHLMRRSRLMVISSLMEGGANVVSEALVAHLPVISSRIPGSIGMLGEDHPGYFEVGDTEGLKRLLLRCERDAGLLDRLEKRSRELAHLYDPARELEAWEALLADLAGLPPAAG